MKKKCVIIKLILNPLLVLFLFVAFLFVIVEASSQEKLRVTCVGNSITYGTKIDGHEKNSYPAQLNAMLGDGYDVRNFAKSWATLLRRGNMPYWDSLEYKQVLEYKPDWGGVKLGTNDSNPMNRILLDRFVQYYTHMVVSFWQLPNRPRVVLLIPFPVFFTDATGTSLNVFCEKLFPILHVFGDADESVPVSENTVIFEQRILQAGGDIKVIHKPCIEHHPHSLANPQQIVYFVLKASEYRFLQATFPHPATPNGNIN